MKFVKGTVIVRLNAVNHQIIMGSLQHDRVYPAEFLFAPAAKMRGYFRPDGHQTVAVVAHNAPVDQGMVIAVSGGCVSGNVKFVIVVVQVRQAHIVRQLVSENAYLVESVYA